MRFNPSQLDPEILLLNCLLTYTISVGNTALTDYALTHAQSHIGMLQQQVRSLKQDNGQLAEANKELKKTLDAAETKQQEWESECNRCVYA